MHNTHGMPFEWDCQTFHGLITRPPFGYFTHTHYQNYVLNMDSIENFKIAVDISMCEKLYDYGNSEFIQKPSTGKWSKQ